ncbi:MAG: hypothetical protein LBT14_11835 [Treponema sp.]|nr:hypothetical protein [Treponema sp.]
MLLVKAPRDVVFSQGKKMTKTDEQDFIKQLKQIIWNTRSTVYASVNFAQVEATWFIGRRIVEQEQIDAQTASVQPEEIHQKSALLSWSHDETDKTKTWPQKLNGKKKYSGREDTQRHDTPYHPVEEAYPKSLPIPLMVIADFRI